MSNVTRRQLLATAAAAAGTCLLGAEPAAAAGGTAGRTRLGDGWAPDELVTRDGWDADESIRTWEPAFSPVQVVTVHHSATPAGEDGAAAVRAVYRSHTLRRRWGDIGYHLLIDPEGVLYAGRYTGDGDAAVFAEEPDGDEPPRCVTGGHVRHYNPGNIGICLLGNFSKAGPTEAATDTLEATLARLCGACDLDPMGTTRYVNPDTRATRQVPTISAHRDWSPTQCPGNAVAAALPQIRKRTAERMS
jgi:N-acetylmuramoyl-L-alanine amidase